MPSPAPGNPALELSRRRQAARWLPVLILLLSVVMPQPGRAEHYPERTVKIIVPFPAGGPTDVAARLIGQSLSAKLGQSVVIENHLGAGGRNGAKMVDRGPRRLHAAARRNERQRHRGRTL